jgi:hypothetical protein
MARRASNGAAAAVEGNGAPHAGGLDAHRLAELREHAAFLRQCVSEARPYRPRQVPLPELEAMCDAVEDLLAEVDRLAALPR